MHANAGETKENHSKATEDTEGILRVKLQPVQDERATVVGGSNFLKPLFRFSPSEEFSSKITTPTKLLYLDRSPKPKFTSLPTSVPFTEKSRMQNLT